MSPLCSRFPLPPTPLRVESYSAFLLPSLVAPPKKSSHHTILRRRFLKCVPRPVAHLGYTTQYFTPPQIMCREETWAYPSSQASGSWEAVAPSTPRLSPRPAFPPLQDPPGQPRRPRDPRPAGTLRGSRRAAAATSRPRVSSRTQRSPTPTPPQNPPEASPGLWALGRGGE